MTASSVTIHASDRLRNEENSQRTRERIAIREAKRRDAEKFGVAGALDFPAVVSTVTHDWTYEGGTSQPGTTGIPPMLSADYVERIRQAREDAAFHRALGPIT